MCLFRDRLEKLWADYGFETFVLTILDAEALYPRQLSLTPANAVDKESFDLLVDRLGMRLGFQEVNRICVCESYLPEHAVELRPASSPMVASAEWPEYRVPADRSANADPSVDLDSRRLARDIFYRTAEAPDRSPGGAGAAHRRVVARPSFQYAGLLPD